MLLLFIGQLTMTARSHSITGDFSLETKFEGSLVKLGKLTASFMAKKYWCVLDEHKLSYYKGTSKVGCRFVVLRWERLPYGCTFSDIDTVMTDI